MTQSGIPNYQKYKEKTSDPEQYYITILLRRHKVEDHYSI
jgi:hypothetical protein